MKESFLAVITLMTVEIQYDDVFDFSKNQRVHFVSYNCTCSKSITVKTILFEWQ